MMRIYSLLFIGIMFTAIANAQIPVTVSGTAVTSPALAANYGSLATALTALNGITSYPTPGTIVFTCAGGNSETAPPTGLTIGSPTLNPLLSSTNTVAILNGGGGAVILNAGVGTSTPGSAAPDGILVIVGADYITIDGLTLIDDNAVNPATMEFGIGLFKLSATDGAQNNTIQNCTITLNRINNASGTAPAMDGSVGIQGYNSTPLAATTPLTITVAGGTNSNNKFYTNTIQNCNIGIGLSGFASATLGDSGNDIGGASSASGNQILNYGGGAATNPAAGIRLREQIGNCNVSYNTINNNNGAGANHATTLRGIYGQTGTSANVTINNNTISVKSGATTSTLTAIENVIGATASGNTVNINNNTITACTYATATSGTFTGILNSASAANVNITGNQLTNNATNATSGTTNLIQNTGAATVAVNINNNNINGWAFNAATSGTLNGINNSGGTATTAISISSNNFQSIAHIVAGTNSHIYITNSGSCLTRAYNSNTFTNLSVNTTGSVTFFSDGSSLLSTGSETMNGNSIVTGFIKGGAGGTVTIRNTNGGSATGSAMTWDLNNFSNITLSGSAAFNGFINTDGGAPAKTITNNTINNLTISGGASGSITGISSSFIGGTTSSISNNTITNITGQGSITGITIGTSGSATTLNVSSNTVTGLTSNGTGGSATGLSYSNPSTTGNVNGNTVNTLSTTGASSTVAGITIGGGTTVNVNGNFVNTLSGSGATSPICNGISVSSGTTVNVFKNKIYNIFQSGAITTTSPAINGILLSGGTTITTSNNFIGDLRTPSASLTDAIRGISVTASGLTTTYSLFYNTVYLNASSTGTNFGTTGIYHNALATSTSATLNLRNNIIVNTSTAAGTGLTVAYRRSGGAANLLGNYGSASNNNLFYAGVPGASNLIYSDGTSTAQTLAAYQGGVFTAGTIAPRDANSVTENIVPSFASTSGSSANFLHIAASSNTVAESGAANIGGITDDYDADIRQGNGGYAGTGFSPDIGADEFEGTNPSLCSGTPASGGTASSSASPVCSGSSVTLTLTGATSGPGIQYQWQSSPAGAGTWTDIGGAISTAVNVVVSANTDYRCVVKCGVSGLSVNSSTAPVNATNCQFNVTRSTGISFTSIAGTGTSMSGWRNGNSTDDNLSTAQPIGFSFVYKGTSYTQFSVSTNGYLTFNVGTTSIGSGSSAYGYFNPQFTTTTGTTSLALAPFYDDLVCQGNPGTAPGLASAMKYQLDGVSPNRTLTVEWIGMETFGNAGPNLNFQVKLYELDNHIEFLYGTFEAFNGTADYGYSYTLGLNGATMSASPTVVELQTQQVENVQNFSNVAANGLGRPPACNSKYTFTPATYGGADPSTGAPANDDPAGAITIGVNSSPCTSLCGTYYTGKNATASGGITACGAVTPGTPDDDVWFKFTATTSQQVITVKGGGGYDAVLQLFSDAGITSLNCVNATGNGLSETISATGLTPGNIYYVRVYHAGTGSNNATTAVGTNGIGVPEFSICVNEIVTPPSNNDPCGAYALSVAGVCTPYSDNSLPSKTSFLTATTTTSNGVTAPGCSGAGTVNDVWFSFVAPAGGLVNATITPVAGVNPAVQLYSVASGSCGTSDLVLNPVSCTNSNSTGSAETPAFTGLTPGATYYLRVYQHPSGTGGAPVSNSQFSICLYIPCPVPTTLAVGSVTTTSASVSFNGGTGTNFIVEYGLAGFTPGTGASAGTGGTLVLSASSPVALNGLTTATSYDVYVRQDCGTGSYSPNSTLVSFSTACSNFSLPVGEGFNIPGSTLFPSCWTQQTVIGTGNITLQISSNNPDTGPFEGTRYVYWNAFSISAGNETRLVSPPITTTGTPGVDVQFEWYNESSILYNSGNYLNEGVQLQYSTDGTAWVNTGSFISRYDGTLPPGTGAWKKKIITLPAAAGNQPIIYVGFKFHSEFGDNCALDAVLIKATPSCAIPATVSVGSITTTTASISFTSAGTNFIVEYGAPGFTPGTDNTPGTGGTIVTGTASPIALTSLTASAFYDVFVRQVCGTDYSENSPTKQFATLCPATTVPYLENFDGPTAPAVPVCVQVQNVNGGNTWRTVGTDLEVSSPNLLRLDYEPDLVTPANDWFFARGLTLTGGTSYRLRFMYRNSDGAGFPEKLEVKYGSAPEAVSMTIATLFSNTNINFDTWTEVTVDFTPASNGDYYIGFHGFSDANKAFLCIDDVSVDVTPACAPPTGISISSITPTTASVNYTGSGTYLIEYGLTGFTPGTAGTPGTGGTTVADNDGSPTPLSGLTGGAGYDVYIRQVCAGPTYGANSSVHSFATPLVNDDAPGAIAVTVDAACAGNAYTNVGSSQSASETFASCEGTNGYHTVWFKFVAPAGGAVRVSNDFAASGLGDSRLAVFSATNVNDYSTFTILGCDDDNGVVSGTKSIVYLAGLTPGNTYYIQVDGYGSSTAQGTFCLQVDALTGSMIAASAACGSSQGYSGMETTYRGWISLVDDSGNLIANVKQTAGTATAISANINVNTGAVRQDATSLTRYLDRNFRISATGTTAADVQFFFLNSELNNLNTADPAVTLANLGVTRQTGSTCQADFLTANGTNSYLMQTGNGTSTDGLVKWVQVTTPGFSNFYLHTSKALMPVKVLLQGACAITGSVIQHKPVSAAWAAVLNANALTQPYNTTGFDSYNGTEQVSPGFFTSTGTGTDITDWILLELRNGNPGTVVARRAAFVRVDGQVVDLDGTSAVSFRGVPSGSYYLDIRHRNHLGIRTAAVQIVDGALGSSTPTTFDFTSGQAQAYQNGAITANAAMKPLTGGLFALWGGNANGHLSVTANNAVRASGPPTLNDYTYLFTTVLAGSTGPGIAGVYNNADVNMDGTVRASGPPALNDYTFLFTTVLAGSTGPGYTQHR